METMQIGNVESRSYHGIIKLLLLFSKISRVKYFHCPSLDDSRDFHVSITTSRSE